MGYEQLNKFADWKPGSNRANVYVHLNNDDVNQATRDEYGLTGNSDEDQIKTCSSCGADHEPEHSDRRHVARPLSFEDEKNKEAKQRVLERLAELEEDGVLEKLKQMGVINFPSSI
jgi:uncharacterized protein YprB with RNaseH-like and TPR domain